jgi:hypothetical protein
VISGSSSSATNPPIPQGSGSASGAPNLPAGFTDTFNSRFIDADGLRQHAVIAGEGPPLMLVHGRPENWLQTPLIYIAVAIL